MKMPKTFHVQHAGRNKNRSLRNENGKWKMENSTFSYCCLSMCVCVCVCWLLATEKSQTNKKLVVEKLLQLQVEKRKSSNRKKKLCANVLMQKFVNVSCKRGWVRSVESLPGLKLVATFGGARLIEICGVLPCSSALCWGVAWS